MKKNQSIFEIIQSLSANEKRFFKIYASRHTIGEQNNYVKLFDLFDKLEHYNDEKINALAQSAPFVKYFSAEKNYLYNMIIDCLDVYHKESSVDRQISKLVNIGRVLLEKKLDKQSTEILERAHKLSAFHNRYENMLPINHLLKRKDFSQESITTSLLTEYHNAEKLMVEQLRTKLYYHHIFDQLLLIRRQHGTISDTIFMNEIMEHHPHLNSLIPNEFESFDIEIYYLISRLEFSRISRDRKTGRLLAKRLITLMENNRAKITGEYIDRYIYTLYVFVVLRLYKTKKESDEALLKLRNLERYIDVKISKREHARCFEFYYNAVTDILLESKAYNKVWEEIPSFEKGFATYQQHMTPTFILALHLNIAFLFFGLGEYRLALKWLNKVRNVTTPFREDIFYDLRTLNLIIHLELGNDDILPSLMKSAIYHNKKNVNTLLQRSIIKHIKYLLKSNNTKQKAEIYKRWKIELEDLKNNPNENRIFNDVDLVAWVNKKCKT